VLLLFCLQNGKEHYVFFAFPHIAINSAGEVGAIARPGRPNKSCACGALQKALIELKAEGYEESCKVGGWAADDRQQGRGPQQG
jgi:hypothetical protein